LSRRCYSWSWHVEYQAKENSSRRTTT